MQLVATVSNWSVLIHGLWEQVGVCANLEQWQLIPVSCLISFIIRLTAEYLHPFSLSQSYLSFSWEILHFHLPTILLIWNWNETSSLALSMYSTYTLTLYGCNLWVCSGNPHIQLFWSLSNFWHESVSDMVRGGCFGHMGPAHHWTLVMEMLFFSYSHSL